MIPGRAVNPRDLARYLDADPEQPRRLRHTRTWWDRHTVRYVTCPCYDCRLARERARSHGETLLMVVVASVLWGLVIAAMLIRLGAHP